MHLSVDVQTHPAETLKSECGATRSLHAEGHGGLVFVGRPRPHCCGLEVSRAYYLMTLCPEWETDPLWVRL